MSVGFMFKQWWDNDGYCSYDDHGTGWTWHEAAEGATAYEMFYIDGMNIARGFDAETHLSFLWNNQIELSYPIVLDILNVEVFGSATAAVNTLEDLKWNQLEWYFAFGAGVRLSIPGFPLGLYLVQNATIKDGTASWVTDGNIGSLNLVLAISTSLY